LSATIIEEVGANFVLELESIRMKLPKTLVTEQQKGGDADCKRRYLS
jgi:hypothetical protein